MAGQYEKAITIKQAIDSINFTPLSSACNSEEVRLEQQADMSVCLIPSCETTR